MKGVQIAPLIGKEWMLSSWKYGSNQVQRVAKRSQHFLREGAEGPSNVSYLVGFHFLVEEKEEEEIFVFLCCFFPFETHQKSDSVR